MATKATIRTAVQQNLDDTNAEKWTTARLDLILPRARRWTFAMMRANNPGHRLIEARTITTTANTAEYALENDEIQVESLERIAVNGSALADVQEYERIDYSDRRKYADQSAAGVGRGFWYAYEATQSSDSGKARRMIGIIPTPTYSAADFKVYCKRRPDYSWETAGSGTEDAYESGLFPEWEDVLIIRATIDALLQRPPREGNTLDNWKQALMEAIDVAVKSDTKVSGKRVVRMTEDWPQC